MEHASFSKPNYTSATTDRKVCYFYDTNVGNYYYGQGHPMKPHRIRMAHNLLLNYGIYKKMEIYRPKQATESDITKFHSDDYIDFLRLVTPDNMADYARQLVKFNVGEDCPVFDGMFQYCQTSAGGSIGGAVKLNHGDADVAVNWTGGLHHAKKSEASGFCYVNDIVLAILELLKYHKRVLYIDIDIHHGDGVEEAFYTTDRVLTVSFHKFGEYFPGTGDIRDIGSGPGKYHAVNFPLKDGIDDESYQNIFRPIIQSIMEIYAPGAVVMQCGADSLSGDRLGCFNLSSKGHGQCVEFVASFGLPLLILGGGGYTIRNVARCWCYETALLVGEELPDELPYNDYIEYYGPDFRLHIPQTNMENQNTKDQLEKYKIKILENIRRIGRPNAASHEIPPDSYPDSDEEELDQEDEDLHPDTRLTERQMDKRIANNDEFSDSDDDDDRRDIRDHEMEDHVNGTTTANVEVSNQEQTLGVKVEGETDEVYGKKDSESMELEQDEEQINNDNEDDDNYEDDNNTNRNDVNNNDNELASDNEDEEKDRPNRNY